MDFIDFSSKYIPNGFSKEYPFILKIELTHDDYRYEKYFAYNLRTCNIRFQQQDISNELRRWLFENFGYSDMLINGLNGVWTYKVDTPVNPTHNNQKTILYLCFKDKNDALKFKLMWV
jgi:hypothetical protein